jgi:glycosyltransferase involved in cell wall biosynthesis
MLWPTMRTVAVMHLAEVTGPPISLHPRLAALARHGELETIVPGPGPVADLYASLGPVHVRRYTTLTAPRSARELASTFRELIADVVTMRRQFRRSRPDLVIVATSMVPAALLASRLARIPTIVYAAEIFTESHRPTAARALLRRPLLWFTHTAADAVVCASEAVARQFDGADGPIVTIHPGIAVASSAPTRDEARRRFDIPATSFCFAVVGSITEGKAQDVAIRALAHVLSTVPDAHCLVAGLPHPRAVDRAYSESILKLAESLEVEHRVRFVGFVQSADVYAASDLLCHPARYPESCSRVVFEAMAYGCPVVATCVGGMGELLTHESDALLVRPGDPRALADAILRIHAEPKLSARLIAAGRALVATSFSEGDGVASFTRLVDGVLSRRGSGRAGS